MESLSTFVRSPLFSPLSSVLGALILIGLFWWRAGSIHSVLDRLWRLIAGKADAHDPVLKSLLQESRDVEKFRYMYRLKVMTIADVHRLAAWMKKHAVGIARLQKMRRWVDVTTADVVCAPSKRYVTKHFIYVCLAMLAVIALGPLATSHQGYFQMRTSNVWFKTDAIMVTAPLGGWSFDLAKCQAGRTELAHLTGFNASETDAICEALKGDSLKNLVESTVKWQQGIANTGVLIAFILVFLNFLAINGAQEALQLRKQLYPANTSSNDAERERA